GHRHGAVRSQRAPSLGIDDEALQWTEQESGSSGNPWQHTQTVSRPLTSFSALRLLVRDRFPHAVDNVGRIAGDLVDRPLQMLGPEADPSLRGEPGVPGYEIHLGVVEERVLVEVR